MLSLKSLHRNKIRRSFLMRSIHVSGEVADKVDRYSTVWEVMQVINITHLPQVARGSRHHVYKDDTAGPTITRVKLLSGNERIMEVARLLSGSEVTATAMKNARELLDAAGNKDL